MGFTIYVLSNQSTLLRTFLNDHAISFFSIILLLLIYYEWEWHCDFHAHEKSNDLKYLNNRTFCYCNIIGEFSSSACVLLLKFTCINHVAMWYSSNRFGDRHAHIYFEGTYWILNACRLDGISKACIWPHHFVTTKNCAPMSDFYFPNQPRRQGTFCYGNIISEFYPSGCDLFLKFGCINNVALVFFQTQCRQRVSSICYSSNRFGDRHAHIYFEGTCWILIACRLDVISKACRWLRDTDAHTFECDSLYNRLPLK